MPTIYSLTVRDTLPFNRLMRNFKRNLDYYERKRCNFDRIELWRSRAEKTKIPTARRRSHTDSVETSRTTNVVCVPPKTSMSQRLCQGSIVRQGIQGGVRRGRSRLLQLQRARPHADAEVKGCWDRQDGPSVDSMDTNPRRFGIIMAMATCATDVTSVGSFVFNSNTTTVFQGPVENFGSSKFLVERRRHSSYAKFRPNRRGYDGRAWNFRLFCATYAAARFGRRHVFPAHRRQNFA